MISYCSILRRVIREAKKVYFKHLLETSENKTKTIWNMTALQQRSILHVQHDEKKKTVICKK
jgi:hypothetical protein